MRTQDWVRLIAFPIIVGIVIVSVQFTIDRYKTTRTVSAVIEGPFAFAQIHELFEKADISINFTFRRKPEDLVQEQKKSSRPAQSSNPRALRAPTNLTAGVEMKVDDLHLYKVTIKNTGNSPIRDLPIRLVFENTSGKFAMLAIQHKTNPAREFGEIKDDLAEFPSPRFVYQLLNPGDEDVITILASEKRDLKVFSKGEGVIFDVTSASENPQGTSTMAILLGVVTGMIASCLMIWFERSTAKRDKLMW